MIFPIPETHLTLFGEFTPHNRARTSESVKKFIYLKGNKEFKT